VLLKATSSDLGATGGVVILAVTLTRAPLLVPLTAMQGNLIAHFVDRRTERLRALLAPAAPIALLTLTGAAAVAAAQHRAYSLGWVGATVASVLLLLLPLPLETRTVVALLCGPLIGIAVHLGALARAHRPTADRGEMS
jgi:hypothetical protein